MCHSAADALRGVPGSLILIPLAVLAVGTEYSCASSDTIATALVTGAPADGSPASDTAPVRLRFVPEGAEHTNGVRLRRGEYLLAAMPRAMTAFTLEVQVACCNGYDVFGMSSQGLSTLLWSVPMVDGLPGLRSRATEITAEAPVTVLRVVPREGDGVYALSAIRVADDTRISHALVAGIPWGLFLLLVASTRFAPRMGGRRLLDAWARADAAIALVIIPTLVFRLTPIVLAISATLAAVAAAVVASRHAFRRLTYPALLYNLVIIVLAAWMLPRFVTRVIEQQFTYEYESTIDHRRRPDGDEINADSIRFRGSSESIDTEDFNIVFLGDSFTYGAGLAYEDTVPSVVEIELASRACDRRVRAINFGWVSSSPLLSLRLLRDVAHKYHPDLVVYLLDMTDFYDDLNYERQFMAGQGTQIVPSRVTSELLDRAALAVFDRGEVEQIKTHLRTASERELYPVPSTRFFVTNQPLERSVEDIERGVMKNLRGIYNYSTNELGAPMMLVVLPRSYQHSDRESPRNWEAAEYEVLGPHVLAPFQYFERRQDELPYDILSLLPAFQQATDFPLYLSDDPHWTPAGARVAARGVTDHLVRAAAVPCA